jgi:hypothetical protein
MLGIYITLSTFETRNVPCATTISWATSRPIGHTCMPSRNLCMLPFIWPLRLPGLGMEPQRYHKILRRFLHPSRTANPYDGSNCLLRGSPRSGLSPVASRWLYSVRPCPLGAGTSIFVDCEDCSAWRSRESVVQPLCWVLSILRCGLRAYCWAASSLRAIGHVLVQPLDRGSFDWNRIIARAGICISSSWNPQALTGSGLK